MKGVYQLDIFTESPQPAETEQISFILDQGRNPSAPARLCRDCEKLAVCSRTHRTLDGCLEWTEKPKPGSKPHKGHVVQIRETYTKDPFFGGNQTGWNLETWQTRPISRMVACAHAKTREELFDGYMQKIRDGARPAFRDGTLESLLTLRYPEEVDLFSYLLNRDGQA